MDAVTVTCIVYTHTLTHMHILEQRTTSLPRCNNLNNKKKNVHTKQEHDALYVAWSASVYSVHKFIWIFEHALGVGINVSSEFVRCHSIAGLYRPMAFFWHVCIALDGKCGAYVTRFACFGLDEFTFSSSLTTDAVQRVQRPHEYSILWILLILRCIYRCHFIWLWCVVFL